MSQMADDVDPESVGDLQCQVSRSSALVLFSAAGLVEYVSPLSGLSSVTFSRCLVLSGVRVT